VRLNSKSARFVRFLPQGKCPAVVTNPVRHLSVAQRFQGGVHSSTLTTQILLGSLSLLLLTMVLGGFLFTMISNQTLEWQYQLRALGIASTTAQMPEIRSALAAKDPQHIIDGLARAISGDDVDALCGGPFDVAVNCIT
jgi:hypothetical protein